MKNTMYIKQLIAKNIGPIKCVTINFPFLENGNPKPIVLVGENGAGKSTIISNIVDAFFEIAGQFYDNANQPNKRNGYQYYKTISPYEIHNGANYMVSVISFGTNPIITYSFKSGKINVNDFKKEIKDDTLALSWEETGNYKNANCNTDLVQNIWDNNVVCYFGPGRYEKPLWLGDKYYHLDEILHPTVKNNWSHELKNPIIVENVTSKNLQWLLDVITDSRSDIEGNRNSMKIVHTTVDNLFLLKQARDNLETVLSKIIGEEVYFQLNYRNSGGSRFKIVKKSDDTVYCPTLDSLSTGQSELFNLFATIVRYADNNDINKSFNLSEITGIVVIDEIELHLHSDLQKEILPELIKTFPKIQFIISSHSPLFLLGMRDTFGDDGFDIYEMPLANKIDSESFNEFAKAYDYLKKTKKYQEELNCLMNNIPSGKKPLIITEGATDWKHIKTAYNVLRIKKEYKALFDNLDIEFLEYEPKNSSVDTLLKIDMGNNAICNLCDSLSKLPNERRYIIIADRDTEKVNNKLAVSETNYKKWAKNVYSVILPVPDTRIKTPNISIEHYYSDIEIETEIEVNGIKRHLFMGQDFNEYGINFEKNILCERKDKCGPNKISIIDGAQNERVRNLCDDSDLTNYALSKYEFASYVCDHSKDFDFSNYVPLFELIKTIINDV